MMPENNNSLSGDNDPLRTGTNGNDDRLQDASNSDAAAENARESERIREASRAAVPSYQLDEDSEVTNEDREDAIEQDPLTTQGSEDEIEENLSGTTNLTIEQLKKEGDPGGYSPEGPEPNDPNFDRG